MRACCYQHFIWEWLGLAWHYQQWVHLIPNSLFPTLPSPCLWVEGQTNKFADVNKSGAKTGSLGTSRDCFCM